MKNTLKDKVVVLTGAGGGIGSAAAERLARHGMKIILFGGRNREKLDAARAAVEKHSVCLVLPGDVTDPEFISSGIAKTVAAFGGIDVLINNAGAAQNTPFERVGIEEFDRLMTINVRVPFLMIRDRQHLLGGLPFGLSHAKHLQRLETRASRLDEKPCAGVF